MLVHIQEMLIFLLSTINLIYDIRDNLPTLDIIDPHPHQKAFIPCASGDSHIC